MAKKSSNKKIKRAQGQLIDPLTQEIITDEHAGQIMCIYAPCNWPFMHKSFVKSFLKLIHPANVVALKKYGVTNYFPLIHDSFPVCKIPFLIINSFGKLNNISLIGSRVLFSKTYFPLIE